MSTFYVLPPRDALADHFAGFLQGLFPGLPWDRRKRHRLTEALEQAVTGHPDVYVVYREDLPADEPAPQALAHAFGAESGDEVIEVRAAAPGELHAERWRIP